MNLRLEQEVPAPPERVFEACVEPERLAEWWGPKAFTAPSLDLDVREGGRYRITMQPLEGEAFELRGEFREVDPPRRLSYTFVWDPPDADDQETLVTLSFLESDGGTRVVLDQGPFKTEARQALHRDGWSEALERLGELLTPKR